MTPTLIDRRHGIRRTRVVKIRHPERRFLATRRVDMSRSRLYFPPSETGWLCFETDGERIRLSPIPDHWPALDDRGLEALRLAAHAQRAGR